MTASRNWAFIDPGFRIADATTEEQRQNLVSAIASLNRGRPLGLYCNLSGSVSKK